MDRKNVIIAIDDLHPEEGWGCEGDKSVGYLEELNKEFGCKFTLFIPSNYHGKYPLSKHKDWIDFWKSKDWVELAAHGHYHGCESKDFGECEFLELDSQVKSSERLKLCLDEWSKVGIRPMGWRNPGWLASNESINVISNNFIYAAVHDEHDKNIKWGCKTFFGSDSIAENNSIGLHGDKFIFQSHIAGDWNDNIWNRQNYENFRNILKYLEKSYKLDYCTLGESIWNYNIWKSYGIHLEGSHSTIMWAQALTHMKDIFKSVNVKTLADIGCGNIPLDLQKAPEFDNIKKVIRVDGLPLTDIDNFRVADLNNESIPISDNEVDFVMSFELIEHLFDTYNFLSELDRISTNGFLVSKPNTDNLGVNSQWYGKKNFFLHDMKLDNNGGRYEHINFIPNYELEGFGEMLGYDVICLDSKNEEIQFFWFKK